VGQFGPKFKVEEDDHYSCGKTRMIDLSYGIMIMWAEVSFILSQFTCLTNGRKNEHFLHTMQHGKKNLCRCGHIFLPVLRSKNISKSTKIHLNTLTVVSNSLCWENVEDDRK